MNINFIIKHINPAPEFDPLNLPRTVSESRFSYDQVHPDALEIIEKLKSCTREGELRRIVWEAFRDQFIADFAGEYDSECLGEASFDIWRYYCR